VDRGALTFGDRLRTEREKRSVSLDEVSASTRIRRSYLEALEQNEFGALPGAVFNRGFVRAYADYLGLDPELLLRAYARELRVRSPEGADEEPSPLAELRRVIDQQTRPRRSSLRREWVAGGAVLLVAAGAVAAWLAQRSPGDPRPAVARTPVPSAAPEARSSAIALTAVSPAETSPVAVEGNPDETPRIATDPRPAEETRPAAPSRPPAPEPSSAMAVEDYGVGRNVVDRVLVGRGDRFQAGREVCFWTRVVGGEPGDQIQHVWMHEGRVARVLELPIDGSHWRTYSRHRLPPDLTGPWAVEARKTSGAVLARVEFTADGPS
jgi:cytoskeleton protein RodZ